MADADSRAQETFTYTDYEGTSYEVALTRPRASDFVAAQKMVGGDAARIPLALAQRCATINGESLKLDNWGDVDLSLFLEVQARLLPGKASETPPDGPSD